MLSKVTRICVVCSVEFTPDLVKRGPKRPDEYLYSSAVCCSDPCLRLLRASLATKHNRYHSPEYRSWAALKSRCFDPQNSAYHYYGGRGISVCERWTSFEHFYTDMGPRPSPKHSIDRINNNGDYCRENCRWATSQEQCRNTRRTHLLTFEGKTLCVTDWALILGIDRHTIIRRLKRGWSVEKTLSEKGYLAPIRAPNPLS